MSQSVKSGKAASMTSPQESSLLAHARAAIRPLYRQPEPEILAPLVVAARVDGTDRAAIVARGKGLLGELRKAQTDGWVNQFLQEYRLGTEEGTALLSLVFFLRDLLRQPSPSQHWNEHVAHSHMGLKSLAVVLGVAPLLIQR